MSDGNYEFNCDNECDHQFLIDRHLLYNRKKLKEETYEHYAGFDALMDTHSVLKDPFKEAEFQSAVTKTTNWVAKNTDWDLSDPLVTKFIETIAFKKANEAIFNEQNDFVNRVRVFVNNNAENKIKKIGAAEFIANMLMPVGKVPTNIVKQLGWGVYGIPKGLLEARKVLKEGIENATPEQKDHILKLLKAGTLGNALLATGALLAYSHFGGMYNQFDKSKRKQDDVKTGESKIGGTEIPKYAEHALPMQLLQSGATMRRIYDYYRSKHEKIPQAIGTAIWGTGFSLISEIPFVNLAEKLFEAKNPYGLQKEANSIAAMAIPQMLKEYAKSHDVDANGNPIVRKPKDIVDAFKYNIPGLRQEVPEAPVKYLDKADIDKPAWKYLTEHGIELPKTNPDKLKFKNENGKEFDLNSLGYTDKQKDDFAKLRTDKIEEKINAAIKNNLLDKLTPEQLKKRIAAYEKMATLFAKNSVRKQIQESKK